MLGKNGCKKSAKQEGFYGKTLGYQCAKILSQREKNYMPWTEKCQFLLVAFYRFLNLEKGRRKKYVKGEGFMSKRIRYKCAKIFAHKEKVAI